MTDKAYQPYRPPFDLAKVIEETAEWGKEPTADTGAATGVEFIQAMLPDGIDGCVTITHNSAGTHAADSGTQFRRDDVDGMARHIEDLNRQDKHVWFNAAVHSEPARRKATVTAVQAVWTDLDDEVTASRREELTGAGFGLVESGGPGKVHVWAKLNEPVDGEESERLNRGLCAALGGDRLPVGPQALMRVPGTVNQKPGAGPVRLIAEPRVWTPDQVTAWSAARAGETAPDFWELLADEFEESLGAKTNAAGDLDDDLGWDKSANALAAHLLVTMPLDAARERYDEIVDTATSRDITPEKAFTRTRAEKCWQSALTWATKEGKLYTEPEVEDEEEYDLSALMDVDFPPLKWVAEPLLPEGAGLVVAPPKIGKSFWSLQLGLDVATGTRFLGRYTVEQGDVLYLALEDGPRRAQQRSGMLLENRRVGPGKFTLWLTAPRIGEGLEEKLTHWRDQHPDARLIIIDVLQKVRPSAHGGSGGDRYKEDYDALGALQKLARRLGVGMLIVHHTRKSESRDEVDAVSGSNGVAGAVDYIVKIERDRNKTEGTVYVTGRDTDESKFTAEFHGKWTRSDYPAALANETPESARRKVYDFLAEHMGGEFRAADIEPKVGLTVKTVRTSLDWLASKRLVEVSGTGKRNDAGKFRLAASPDELLEALADPLA